MNKNSIICLNIGESVIIANYDDWEKHIHQLLTNTGKENIFLKYDFLPKNEFTVELVDKLKKIIKKGEYYTLNIFDNSIIKRKVLDLTAENSKKQSCNVDFRKGGFRNDSYEVIESKVNKYLTALLDPIFGLFKGHYRGVSDVMPLLAIDAQIGKRKFDAYGRASIYKEAYYTSILEALERYHGAGNITKKCIINSENFLKRFKLEYVSLFDFYNYTEYNYKNPYFELPLYNEFKTISWIESYDVLNDKSILIPEQIAFFSNELMPNRKYEQRYISETSNGTAIGSNWYEASISALLELIERDSFLVHWFTKSSPKRIIDIYNIKDTDVQMMLSYLTSIEYEVYIFDITLETSVPCYWILLQYTGKDKKNLAFYTSAACNFDSVKAIKSALIEATTSIKVFKKYMYTKYSKEELEKLKKNFYEVKNLEDHLYLFSDELMSKYFEFAINTPHTISFLDSYINSIGMYQKKIKTQKELFGVIIEKLRLITEQIYITDLSTKFLVDMGLSCVKIHIPSMQNISFGMQYQNINKKRLKNAIKNNNLDGNLNDIFICPHPFP